MVYYVRELGLDLGWVEVAMLDSAKYNLYGKSLNPVLIPPTCCSESPGEVKERTFVKMTALLVQVVILCPSD